METDTEPTIQTQKSSWGLWQQVMVVGVGTCAMAYMLPRIMAAGDSDRKFIQEELLTAIKADTASDTALALKIDETNDILRPMVKRLTDVATAVNAQVESEKDEP
jgi:hypothetical protein